jgi:CheY-like chemotaxis protein
MQPRILLAEPDPEHRQRLEPLLKPLGAEVTTAGTGDQLEQRLLELGPFDLVIANSRLTGLSALQVLARCRQRGTRTPFIVLASLSSESWRLFVSDAEGTVLSSRVINPANFVRLVRSMLKSESSPPSPRG